MPETTSPLPSDSLAVCRPECGACCIAPSITSPIPGMPFGKPAGIPCVQLLPDLRCALFGKPERPSFCTSLRPTESMCGANRADALARLTALEFATRPGEPIDPL
ncbi:MAG: hypothetical protein RIR76_708 [Verrucomicrobiota bacterium]|jgi:hypothetical protein